MVAIGVVKLDVLAMGSMEWMVALCLCFASSEDG